ncbi:hypothetical protein B4098_1103 [Heyndrickxia coagulans]|jgi:hypothetical protein|uniref:Uncharacterized protein n=1 Tax=Heyndrickxia coagulans TaxID=1398 RepID=A0A150JWH3_HEYCO|nr:hypothetical protein B4098_1103 [Heyndrickxia coagulans]KYC61655.1 hypothetical protein B4099_1354 [Heyndrickxia coagulans]
MGNKMAGNFPAVFFYHLIELQPCTGCPAFSEKADKYGKLYASTFSTGTMLK